jgi:choline dehydrogenase-like flavoprotein
VSDEVDVCVIGAGAGGGVAAWELVRRGARVLLLDTGPRFDPKTYDTHHTDWELVASPIAAVADAPEQLNYESAPGAPLDPRFAHLTSRSPSQFSGPPPRRRRSFYYSRAIGVGGSTLHFQAEAHRFPAHAFRLRSERGVAEDWPIDYAELAPYYERVEQLIGVAGDPSNPFKAARGPYPYAAHPLSAASRRVAAGAQRLGWQLLPNSVAILPQAREGRSACHYCNGCVRGCAVAAKGSVDVAVIPEAERTGRLQLETGFRMSRFEHDADGRITAVIGRDADETEQRRRARAFVLAAGAIETPRILLNSAGGAHPHGPGGADGQLGRHLMETLYVFRSARFDVPLETYAGIPIDNRIWDFNGASTEGPNGSVGYALEAVEGFGLEHREAMQRRFGAVTTLFGIAEQHPRPENRVGLSEQRDRFGVPLARVETTPDALDLEALSQIRERLGELASASGVVELPGQTTAYDTPSATHVGGTCRMGRDPSRSVVDPLGAVVLATRPHSPSRRSPCGPPRRSRNARADRRSDRCTRHRASGSCSPACWRLRPATPTRDRTCS